jgi:hypothetical protein
MASNQVHEVDIGTNWSFICAEAPAPRFGVIDDRVYEMVLQRVTRVLRAADLLHLVDHDDWDLDAEMDWDLENDLVGWN